WRAARYVGTSTTRRWRSAWAAWRTRSTPSNAQSMLSHPIARTAAARSSAMAMRRAARRTVAPTARPSRDTAKWPTAR
ncbi:MAG: hypothetical protein AVDCRST_MAG69-2358, partial [uncultured Solirubrobacteraceae bacterium]